MNNTSVESYLLDGCGRCEKYRTPECKVHRWHDVLVALRALMLETELDELKRKFRPEFINRVDSVIVFRELSQEDIYNIVDIVVERVNERLAEYGLRIRISERAKSWLSKEGYSPEFGARPLRRVIQTEIEDRLSDAVLSGAFKDGDTVLVDVDEEENIRLELAPNEAGETEEMGDSDETEATGDASETSDTATVDAKDEPPREPPAHLTTQHLDDGVIQRLARWPALTFSQFLLSVFATNERRIRRDREFEADRVGAAAATPAALASALLKFSVFSDLWPRLQRLAVAEVQAGMASPDLAVSFEALARRDTTGFTDGDLASILRERTIHPFDTHPPTVERLDALGVNASESELSLADGWAHETEVDSELARLGEELTAIEMPLIEAYVAERSARTPQAT